jgi:hypothetical protein
MDKKIPIFGTDEYLKYHLIETLKLCKKEIEELEADPSVVKEANDGGETYYPIILYKQYRKIWKILLEVIKENPDFRVSASAPNLYFHISKYDIFIYNNKRVSSSDILVKHINRIGIPAYSYIYAR